MVKLAVGITCKVIDFPHLGLNNLPLKSSMVPEYEGKCDS